MEWEGYLTLKKKGEVKFRERDFRQNIQNKIFKRKIDKRSNSEIMDDCIHKFMRTYKSYKVNDVLNEYTCVVIKMLEEIRKEEKEIEEQSRKGKKGKGKSRLG